MADPNRLELASRKTYRYLRVAVVAMAVLLGVSVGIEIVFGPRGGILDSISAYYYTPVRGVFVGSLMAVGLGLVAIKGREGWEDIMLNLAGMLAPLVALVPTPISVPVAGFEVERRTVPAALVPAVENNVAALLVLGVVGLVFAAATVEDGPYRSAHLRGVAGAGVLLVGLAVWFGVRPRVVPRVRPLRRGRAHVRADRGGRRRQRTANPQRCRDVTARRGDVPTGVRRHRRRPWGSRSWWPWSSSRWARELPWLFWVEVVLLALFAAFWVFQTAENWNEGLPEGAAGRDEWRVGVDGGAV